MSQDTETATTRASDEPLEVPYDVPFEDLNAAQQEAWDEDAYAEHLIYGHVLPEDREIIDGYLNHQFGVAFALGVGSLERVVGEVEERDLSYVKFSILEGLQHGGEHHPQHSEFGDGWNEPREEALDCSCGEDLLAWQQNDQQCSGRPSTEEYFAAYVSHLKTLERPESEASLRDQVREALNSDLSDAEKLALIARAAS